MPSKKAWKDWVVDYIIRTETCPGDEPSFGLPTDMLTKEEFDACIAPMPKHKHTDCHFVAEILGVAQVTEGMTEVKVSEGDYEKKAESFRGDIKEVQKAKRVAKLKENLHLYVSRIHFKSSGNLSVPKPLLDLGGYINKFFEENG